MSPTLQSESEAKPRSVPSDGDAVLARRRAEREKLKTSKFDVVTSFFMALILFIGTFVLMLFIVWLLTGDDRKLVLKPMIEPAAGRGPNAEGFERDFEPPGEEEVEELLEPTLEDTLEAVTDAVSTVAASLQTNDTKQTATTVGDGMGDSRPPGPMGEGVDAVPRYERWQLEFSAKDIKEYAQQLDHFKIELAVTGGPVQGVDYAFDLSTQPKKRSITDTTQEGRLYFMWTKPTPLKAFDEQLLRQAGVSLEDRIAQVRFIPAELENLLANIEMDYARSKGRNSVTQIAKTIFSCVPASDGYTFEVMKQRYRTPRSAAR